MALFAMGDFHLSFSTDKPMDVFGREWKDHVKWIEKYCRKRITDTDTLVITGDHSWGRNLEECRLDLESGKRQAPSRRWRRSMGRSR